MNDTNLDLLKEPILSLIDIVSEVGYLLHEKGWAEGNGGNFSIRINQPIAEWFDSKKIQIVKRVKILREFINLNEHYFIIKGAGKRMRDIKKNPESSICIGKVYKNEFQIIWPKNCPFNPSSELISHLTIQQFNIINYKSRVAVLHTHPTELIALSFLSKIKESNSITKLLEGISPNISLFIPEGIGYLPYKLPSSEALANETLNLIKKYRLILWAKHGIISIGDSLTECYDFIDIINKAAKIYFLLQSESIELLDDNEIKELKEHH